MFDEIGSEFWGADCSGHADNQIDGAVFAASGRSAQSLIIACAKLNNRRALLPAYTCQHIVEPFDWIGWDVDYYTVNKDLSIDLDSLRAGIEKSPGCVIVQSFYGFNTVREAEPYFRQAQKDGAIILEDLTHSFLGSWGPGYPEADFQFCSLRKWSGLTDGGYARSLCGVRLYTPQGEMDAFAGDRLEAQAVKRRFIKTGSLEDKEEYLRLFKRAEDLLDGDVGIYAMSKRAKEDFASLDFDFIHRKRRENYQTLLSSVASDYVKPIFDVLPEDTCPIMFPVYIENGRQELLQELIDNRIYCPVHWPAPVQLTPEAVLSSSPIYNQIMSIPCDQRYGTDDMKRIAELVNAYTPKY